MEQVGSEIDENNSEETESNLNVDSTPTLSGATINTDATTDKTEITKNDESITREAGMLIESCHENETQKESTEYQSNLEETESTQNLVDDSMESVQSYGKNTDIPQNLVDDSMDSVQSDGKKTESTQNLLDDSMESVQSDGKNTDITQNLVDDSMDSVQSDGKKTESTQNVVDDSIESVQSDGKKTEMEHVCLSENENSQLEPSSPNEDNVDSDQVNNSTESDQIPADDDNKEDESNPTSANKSEIDKEEQVSDVLDSSKSSPTSPSSKDDANTTTSSELPNSPSAEPDNKAMDMDESDNADSSITVEGNISENHFVECESYRNPDENDSDMEKSMETRMEEDVLAQTETNIDDSAKSIDEESTEFIQVIGDCEKDLEDNSLTNKDLMEVDPIASVNFLHNQEEVEEMERDDDRELDETTAPATPELPEGQGENEELCIIPDTERVISQAEKDAASALPPLRDISETATETLEEPQKDDESNSDPVIVHKYDKEDLQVCSLENCTGEKKVDYCYNNKEGSLCYICDANCLKTFKTNTKNVIIGWEEINLRVKKFCTFKDTRLCKECKKPTNDIVTNLTWEIMDFCNELCLTKYQKEIGSNCANCQKEVISSALGKYCVRFGNDVRQFCSGVCLEEFKKDLKVCSYCQQDMSTGAVGFLAPVGDKGHFKDFCSQNCMEKYDVMTNNRPPTVEAGTTCNVCKNESKQITIEYEFNDVKNYFCGEPCFVAFCFVNSIQAGKCNMCKRNFSESKLKEYIMYYDNVPYRFCSNSCRNIYIIAHRKIVPCSWCKVKKYNFDMIRRYNKDEGTPINMCSVNCLTLYQVSINAATNKRTTCDYCKSKAVATYSLTMSDASIRNFCTYSCVMDFQGRFTKPPLTLNVDEPIPTGNPQRVKRVEQDTENNSDFSSLPVITNVQSLATNGDNHSNLAVSRRKSSQLLNETVQIQVRQHYIVRPAPIPDQRNVGTMCGVRKAHKSFVVKPSTANKECQTDEREAEKILIPVPVPIYVPTPLHMFSTPVPFPVPFPIPVPVPIFIPTTRNSATGILKEIKKIQVKIPTDPYEAELLMMAEMVAGDKKEENHTDSESDIDGEGGGGGEDGNFSPEPDATNTFGDDMLQMALKMATEMDEPAVDLEGALTANTITAQQGSEGHDQTVDDNAQQLHMIDRQSMRGRKRGARQSRGSGAKRGRRSHHNVDMPIMTQTHPQPPPPPPEPIEKPDANMCLKFFVAIHFYAHGSYQKGVGQDYLYTFGVNAWKQWVSTKNAELEKSSRRIKLFKTEILQLTADELNYSLCLFVKEVRKPNGAEYAPDTIYYLCLGIQQYLFENGRIDNIFCDPYYEKFTDCLDEVARKFSVLYNDSHYIVTRVEEEHLWESKQLGAHSPHVLLSTLMFFNTKHFNLTSVDEHMQLSFSHIMKHWKRNPNQPGASKLPGSRNVLLRFYPPQSAIQNNARKKKVYEQQENEENPLRCPVKLYEFYLSKCPESVKTRNDVFYLQPERSCVPDSPVWYSTMPLPRESLEKMLHRVKMVKEINVALLTS